MKEDEEALRKVRILESAVNLGFFLGFGLKQSISLMASSEGFSLEMPKLLSRG